MDQSGVNNPAYKHGHTEGRFSPEYHSWSSMKTRVLNKNRDNYKHYGGRGITICERWLVFEFFLADMGYRPSAFHSLDRVDVNGNYEPGNCRWALPDEQASNKRPGKWDKMLSLIPEIVAKGIDRTDTIALEFLSRGYKVHKETVKELCRKAVKSNLISKELIHVEGERSLRCKFTVCIHNGDYHG